MASGVPPPTLTIHEWPDPSHDLPLALYALDDTRADRLRELLPPPRRSGWVTACPLLAWTGGRWTHANDHVEDPDALDLLERVDRGERFACVEYSIVLSQALNALSIPARRVDLRQRNHRVGVGRGHVVSDRAVAWWSYFATVTPCGRTAPVRLVYDVRTP